MITRRAFVQGAAGLLLPAELVYGNRLRRNGGAVAGYDAAARVAALRSNSGFGSYLTANHTDFPEANGGLALPVAPTITSSQTRFVLSAAQTSMNTASGGIAVTLSPNTYTGDLTISTGSHNTLIADGVTINGNLIINGGSATHHLKIDGGTNGLTVNGSVYAWKFGASDSDRSLFANDIHFKNVTANITDTSGDNSWRAFRVLLENCTFDHSMGKDPMFIWPWSSNIVVMNSKLRAAKTATLHENPCRANGAHMFFVIDSFLEVYYNGGSGDTKYCWRSHRSGGLVGGGCNGIINTQLNRGGVFTGNGGDAGSGNTEVQNSQLVFRDIMLYEPSGVTAGDGFNVPNSSPEEINTNAYMVGTRYYNDEQPPGTTVTITPPGTRSDNIYADYTSTPAWNFYTSTPTTS